MLLNREVPNNFYHTKDFFSQLKFSYDLVDKSYLSPSNRILEDSFYCANDRSDGLDSFVRERRFHLMQEDVETLKKLYYHMQFMSEAQLLSVL